MFEEIQRAIAQQDYTTATELIRNLKQQYPDHPWLKFYTARIQEAQGDHPNAHKIYKEILQHYSNSKLLSKARQGIHRLQQAEKEQKQTPPSQAKQGEDELGVFVLGAVPNEQKKQAAQTLAKILQIDAYNARLKLPSRGLRLAQIGAIAQLNAYRQQLEEAEIPCFCCPLNRLNSLHVFQVQYIHSQQDKAMARCWNSRGQEGKLSFQWSEIQRRVQGRVPIFEKVFTPKGKNKFEWKSDILDYVQFCDLHLPKRKAILRLCDQQYQFRASSSLSSTFKQGETLNQSWMRLMQYLDEQLPNATLWRDFVPFGESAIAFPHLLRRIPSQITLKQQQETVWDCAFQLYSSLIFFKEESDPGQP